MNRSEPEQLRRLQSVTDAALGHLELNELLDALLARTREAFEADTCAILLLDDDAGELVARAAVGIEEEVEAGVRVPLGRGFAGRIAAERCAIVIEDVQHGEVLNPTFREKGVTSLLGVPPLTKGEARGVLHVGTLERREFTTDDIELLQLVANRAAIAIEHARVLESERRARTRLVPRVFTADDTELLLLVAQRVALAIERARLHERLIEIDQLKLNFVAVASHELRRRSVSAA